MHADRQTHTHSVIPHICIQSIQLFCVCVFVCVQKEQKSTLKAALWCHTVRGDFQSQWWGLWRIWFHTATEWLISLNPAAVCTPTPVSVPTMTAVGQCEAEQTVHDGKQPVCVSVHVSYLLVYKQEGCGDVGVWMSVITRDLLVSSDVHIWACFVKSDESHFHQVLLLLLHNPTTQILIMNTNLPQDTPMNNWTVLVQRCLAQRYLSPLLLMK